MWLGAVACLKNFELADVVKTFEKMLRFFYSKSH